MVGQTIAYYRVTGKLGAGGMGEVYRATDTRLNRDVAIKILPAAFAQDSERLGRFAREAQLLASLNHPNIGSIYGLEEADDVRCLVLELVEGETLAERVGKRPLPLEEALRISRQIADALEAAHDRGIIHRDLKPANVKVTPEGTVKVLDFGLAKALEGEASEEDISKSPTLTTPATQQGVILGTAAYMSPEQAKGKRVDRRADIWAFGVVLFEMLTGQQLFSGETVSETLAAVMMTEPDWKRLQADTPSPIRQLLRRCLIKDPRQRLQAIGEARIAIEEYVADPTRAAEEAGTVPTIQPQPAWRRLPWALAGGLLIVAAIALGGLWRATRPVEQPPLRLSVQVSADEPLSSIGAAAVLSPDATRLAYVAGSGTPKLYVRSLDQLEGNLLSGTEGAAQPFFSTDGQWIGFFANNKLKKVSVFGGAVVTLCDVTSQVRGGTWGPDDTIVFTSSVTTGMSRVPAAGGAPEQLTKPDADKNERSHRWPQFLPGGQAVLFTSQLRNTDFDEASLEVLDLETSQRKLLQRGGSYGRYVPSGHLTYVHEGTLFAAPFDLDRLEVTGPPAPVLEGVMFDARNGGAQYAFSDTGALIYLSGTPVGAEASLVWRDRQGKTQPLLEELHDYLSPHLSPDGDRLVAHFTAASTAADVWIYELKRGTLTRLTFDAAPDMEPIWTPDGQRVTFSSTRDSAVPNLFWKRADGAGEAERLTQSDVPQFPTSWSPDGQVLAFHQNSPETNWDIYVLRLEEDRKPELFLQTPFGERNAVFSPDGRWLAYMSNESGQWEVYVRPFPGPGGKWQISTAGGRFPLWSRKRRELVYVAGDCIMAVPYSARGRSFRAERPQLLFQDQLNFHPFFSSYDITPDGKRFVMLKVGGEETSEGTDRTHLTFIFHWFDDLRRVVPTGKN